MEKKEMKVVWTVVLLLLLLSGCGNSGSAEGRSGQRKQYFCIL